MQVFLALPIQNEFENLPSLLACLTHQSFHNFKLVVCINQPDAWWNEKVRKHICLDNQESFRYLRKEKFTEITILDRYSQGNGWKGKRFGVGWARKTAMDAIDQLAGKDDLIVSIDADTSYPAEYLQSVVNLFDKNPDLIALSNPYYHRLTKQNDIDRAVLRYEIYMRNYSLNMLRIKSPYAYTALGSAIALPVWAYRKIGGITPHKSGEDFYLLQKLSKTGKICSYNCVKVYPSSRVSGRVFFGTGPAVKKGLKGEWNSYPVYHYSQFNRIMETFNLFEELYSNSIPTPMDDFLKALFRESDIWEPLRNNSSGEEGFKQLCMQKIDGLRILQFLKKSWPDIMISDEISLMENMNYMFGSDFRNTFGNKNIDFSNSRIELLDQLRNYMSEKEMQLIKAAYDNNIRSDGNG